MGLEVGPERIGQLAVGARADLAHFDVPVGSVARTLQTLALDGEGRCAATVVAGQVRHTAPGAVEWEEELS